MVSKNNLGRFVKASILLFHVSSVIASDDCSSCSSDNYVGVIAPLFTPYKNGTCEVNTDNLCEVQDLNDQGVDGYLLTGKNGEGYLLSEDECKLIYKICVKKIRDVNETAKIYVQVGDPAIYSMELAKYAANLGVDGIFVLPYLYYNRQILSAQTAVDGLKMVADCVPDTPVYFSMDPLALIGVRLNAYEVFKLALDQVSNFGGLWLPLESALQIKSAGIYNPSKHTLIIRQHYSINAASYLGFQGTIALATTLAPQLSVKIWYTNDYMTACKYQDKLNTLINSITSPSVYISATKTAYSLLSGDYQGNPRSPIPQISCDQKKKIASTLKNLGYDLKASPKCNDDDDDDTCSCQTCA